MPALVQHQFNLACTAIRPVPQPQLAVKAVALGLARIATIGLAQDLERGPDIPPASHAPAKGSPLQQDRPVAPAMSMDRHHCSRT